MNHSSPSKSDGNDNAGIRVLAVMPSDQDGDMLDRMLPRPEWSFNRARNVTAALTQLHDYGRQPALVLCDGDSVGSAWKEILGRLQKMDKPPLLIVTSRLADEQLWAEALNLGAYDVLAKPFEPSEVRRTLNAASMRWQMDSRRAQAIF